MTFDLTSDIYVSEICENDGFTIIIMIITKTITYDYYVKLKNWVRPLNYD